MWGVNSYVGFRYGEEKSVTDRNGSKTQYERDARGNVLKKINMDGSYTLTTYDNKNNITSERDESGKYTFYVYDAAMKNLLKKVQPLNGTDVYGAGSDDSKFAITSYAYYTDTESSTLGYRAKGLLKSVTDPEGNTTTYTYDTYGNIKTMQDPLNNTITNTYDIIGNKLSTITAKGFITDFVYDNNGRLEKQVLPGGETSRITYDAEGRKTKEISANQYTASSDNLAAHTYSGDQGTRTAYYDNGKPWTVKDAENHTTTFTYDSYGNVLTETKDNGSVYEYAYDAINRLTATRFKESAASAAILLEEVSYAILADGKTTKTQKTYSRAAESATTVYTYDYAGRQIEQLHPDGSKVSTAYNANGTVVSSTDARLSTTVYNYDGLNRLTEQWVPFETVSGSILYAYTSTVYDKAGKKKQEKTSSDKVGLNRVPVQFITVTYAYDANGQVKSVIDNEGRKTAYQYDADGGVIRTDVYTDAAHWDTTEAVNNYFGKPDQTITHLRAGDLAGQDYNSTADSALITSYTYDKNGNLLTANMPNNVTTTTVYDHLGRALSVSQPGVDEGGNSVILTTAWTYDEAGNKLTTRDANGNTTASFYGKRGTLDKVTDAGGSITAFYYDLMGRKIAAVSPQNYDAAKILSQMNRTEYAYDSMGRLKTESAVYMDAASSQFMTVVTKAFQYDTNGNVVKQLDALGYEAGTGTTVDSKIGTGYGTENVYNEANLAVTVLDPVSKDKGLAFGMKFAYDALGRKLSETNAAGVITGYTYNNASQVTAVKVKASASDPEQGVKTSTYDGAGNLLTETDGNGRTTSFEYNAFGKVRKAIYPGDATIPSNTVTFQYDAMGNLVRQQDSLGAVDLYTYDNQGRNLSHTEQSQTGAEAITTSVKYDKNGNKRFETDSNNVTNENVYDRLNRLTTTKITVNGVVQTTSFGYDKNGNPTTQTDWLGNVYTSDYDPLNRLVEKKDPYNKTIQKVTYNRNNAQLRSYDALGAAAAISYFTEFSYDKNNRLLSTKDPENHITSQTYDKVGNMDTKTDGNGNITSYSYDAFNRLKSVTNALSETTGYTYDVNGNMLSQTDGKGNVTVFEYNAANKMTRKIDPGGRSGTAGNYTYDLTKVESYAYYADSALKSKVDRNGITTSYTYDSHGRLQNETAGDITNTYTYDNNGNQLTMADGTGTTTRTYDERNRVISKTVPNIGTIAFQYDIIEGMATGTWAETSVDPKNNQTTKIYDNAGRLWKVTAEGQTTIYAYNDNGSRQSITYPDGSKEVYTYYKDNLVNTLINKKANASIIDNYTYTYDAQHNMLTKIDGKGTTSYTYDLLNRLLSVTESNGTRTGYTYDAAGNRLTETVTVGSLTTLNTYSYNSQNRLMQITSKENGVLQQTTDYAYDNNGNQLTTMIGGVITVTNNYDKLNQLITTVTGSTTVGNIYNGEGYRVSKAVNGTLTRYLYESDQVVLELDGTGNQSARNVYGTNLLVRQASGQSYYYMYNGHADVTALLNAATGNIDATYYYDAFGVLVPEGTTGNVNNSITYAGYQYDKETGLYYLNARMYDPKLARFLQEDTYRGDPNDPLSLNLYTYTNNNPILYDDPTGHWPKLSEMVSGVKKAAEKVADFTTMAVEEFKDSAVDLWNDPVGHMSNLNEEYIKPFVKETLGIEEDSHTYKAIKYVGVRSEAAVANVTKVTRGAVELAKRVEGTFEEVPYAALSQAGLQADRMLGLIDEERYQAGKQANMSVLKDYGSFYGNLIPNVYNGVKSDLKATLDGGNAYNAFFNPNASLTDVADYQMSAFNTATVAFPAARVTQVGLKSGLTGIKQAAAAVSEQGGLKAILANERGSFYPTWGLGGKWIGESLEKRAKDIHGTLPEFTQSKTTTAVGRVTNPDGSTGYLVGSSERRLRPSQREALNPNEVEAVGEGHAEVTIINQAKANGQTVEEIAASRPICSACEKSLGENDIAPGSPLKSETTRRKK